ncbi:ATP-binding protein [Magnetococcales bacterium HHB-1]
MRSIFLPDKLSQQMTLIMLIGITACLIIGAAIHLRDRGEALTLMGQAQVAQRITAISTLFDTLSAEERKKISLILETPLQYVRLLKQVSPMMQQHKSNASGERFRQLIAQQIEKNRSIKVMTIRDQEWERDLQLQSNPFQSPWMSHFIQHHKTHVDTMYQIMPDGISLIAQIELQDGSWMEFHNHLPRESFSWPQHLFLSITILFLVIFSLSVIAVRLATRPLTMLSAAAQALGENINTPPLPETGPLEVRLASRAFNGMQARFVRFIQERSHLLAAISHDLRTPLTRMRLRIEMLKDETLKARLLPNLDEMEKMIIEFMAYIKGMERVEKIKKVDVCALLECLQEEHQEMGREITLECHTEHPFPLMEDSLKRCLNNLVTNAVIYGYKADIKAVTTTEQLQITISDEGPGIPKEKMEQIIQPFIRLEDSRNKKTGGSGLGLAIADNIVRAHFGELELKNGYQKGLIVSITIPYTAIE